MKILYSIQATGNGHISRAMELVPFLKKHGKVDLFLSGSNSTLSLDIPVKYRSRGISLFYTCNGTLDYWKTTKSLAPWRVAKEAQDLPVEKYDMVVNDFECITSMACAYKKVPSVHFGHQASFISDKVPRPEKKNRFAEWLLKNYAKAPVNIGLHFECYDDFILSPVIKEEILGAEPTDKGHISIYLPSYCEKQLLKYLLRLKDIRFEVFSRETKYTREYKHITFIPVDNSRFNKSLTTCMGLITGAGFETPAEALYLKKKLLAIPIKGQYEQECNAAALKKLGVHSINKIDDDFPNVFNNWIHSENQTEIFYPHSTQNIVDQLMCKGMEVCDIE